MHGWLLELGVDSGVWLKALFEPSLLLLFVVCLGHSLETHGWRRTLREFVAGFTLTWLAESTAVLSGAYVYPGFKLYVGATPFVNPASWVALVYILIGVSNRLLLGSDPDALEERAPQLLGGSLIRTLLVLAMIDASLALSIDLVLDPLATIYNWWIWVPAEEGVHTVVAGTVDPYNFTGGRWVSTPDNVVASFFAPCFDGAARYPTRILGIPLINFAAWWVFVFSYAIQFRWVESRASWTELRRTCVLWGLMLLDWPILSLLLISPNL